MKALGYNASRADVEKMINEIDKDQSGTIEYNEFEDMMKINMLGDKDLEKNIIKSF